MKESSLVRRIMDRVRQEYPGSIVRKLSDRFSRGYPDIVIYLVKENTLNVLEVECKTDTGRLTKLQEYEQTTVNKLGEGALFGILKSITARSVDEVLEALKS